MKMQVKLVLSSVAVAIALGANSTAEAQYAVEVVSYDAGTTPAVDFGTMLPYDVQAAALGEPSRFTSDDNFPGIVSPFSPPYKRDQLISIGENGHATLRLSNYVIPQPGGAEIGVFTNAGLVLDFANGVAATPAATFGADMARVEVSEDGVSWFDLAEQNFELATNGYTDLDDPFSATAGAALSDFQQPFTQPLSDFAGLPYSDASDPDIVDLLGGSGGGTWLDISGTGLAQVGFIRFSVADNGDPNPPGLNFELDAVSIAHAAMGGPTVPEPATLFTFAVALIPLVTFRWRSIRRAE